MTSLKHAAEYLKAMGEETRLKIISFLIRDSYCVCELVDFLQMSQPSISQHLKRLKETGIILEEKRGRWSYYSLNKEHEFFTAILHLASLLPTVEKQESIGRAQQISCS